MGMDTPQDVSNSRPGFVSVTWKWMDEPVEAFAKALATMMLVTCQGAVSMSALQGSCLGCEAGRAWASRARERALPRDVSESILVWKVLVADTSSFG